MKTIKIMATMLTPVLILAIAFALVGCEDEPDSNTSSDPTSLVSGQDRPGGLTILPDGDALISHAGQVIEFEVRGGHWPYTWETTDPTSGTAIMMQTVESDIKFTAVYTATKLAVNTVYVTDGHGRTGTKETR